MSCTERLDAIEYKSEYERAMTLKPYLDLKNSFDTKFREGKIEGKTEEKVALAIKMKRKSYDMAEIVELTGLSVKEIEKLKLVE